MKAGSRISTCKPDDKVPLERLARHMKIELSKMRHMTTLPLYVSCTAVLVALLCAHRVSFFARSAPLYYQLEAERLLRADEFRGMSDMNGFFPWLRQAIASAENQLMSPNGARVLSIVPLRQLRDIQQSCVGLERHWDAVDSLTQHYMMQHGCILEPEYDSMPPTFGRNDTFHLASTSELQGFEHVADFHNIDDPTITYQTSITLVHATEVDAVDQIEANDWLDVMTSAVVVDFVLLFEQSQLLVVASFIMERTTTGMFSSMARTAAFRFFTASPGLIALDVLAFLGFAVAGVSVVVDVFERYALQIPPIAPTWKSRAMRCVRSVGLWEWFTAALVGSVMTVNGMRFHLWILSGTEIDGVDGAAAFNLAVDAQQQFTRTYELYCVSLLLICFRLFYAFRYIAGLHKISSTLSASAPDLARVLVVWMGLLFVFTVSGCMIFGRDVFGMRTFWRALSFMMSTLVSGSLDAATYKVMLDSQGYITDVYLVTLFITFWLVLLNLVTSIISNAFFVTEMHTASFNPEGFLHLLSTYVFFNNNHLYGVDRVAKARGEFIDTLPPTQRVASSGVRRLIPFHKRLPVLLRLRRWRNAIFVALLESAVRKARVRSQTTVTYSQAMKVCQQFEERLSTSQLSGPLIIAEMFAFVMRADAPILHSMNENRENFARMHTSVEGISRMVKTLTDELRGHRDRSPSGLLQDAAPATGGRPRVGRQEVTLEGDDVTSPAAGPSSSQRQMLKPKRERGCSLARAEAHPSLVDLRRASLGGCAQDVESDESDVEEYNESTSEPAKEFPVPPIDGESTARPGFAKSVSFFFPQRPHSPLIPCPSPQAFLSEGPSVHDLTVTCEEKSLVTDHQFRTVDQEDALFQEILYEIENCCTPPEDVAWRDEPCRMAPVAVAHNTTPHLSIVTHAVPRDLPEHWGCIDDGNYAQVEKWVEDL
jgi:hypothetical protein